MDNYGYATTVSVSTSYEPTNPTSKPRWSNIDVESTKVQGSPLSGRRLDGNFQRIEICSDTGRRRIHRPYPLYTTLVLSPRSLSQLVYKSIPAPRFALIDLRL